MGGVLFVDEASALPTEGLTPGNPFGPEAIDVAERMEDDRTRFVVISAGLSPNRCNGLSTPIPA
jgi:hypothetical protein